MNVNDIKLRICGGLGHGLAYLGASRKSLVRGGRCTALVVAIVLASQGAAGAAGAPSGTRVSEPEALAGPPGSVRPPRTFEQLGVFGKSSMSVPRSIVDPRWSPGSDWNNNTDLNNFDPSRWYQALIDPSWELEPLSARTTTSPTSTRPAGRWGPWTATGIPRTASRGRTNRRPQNEALGE